MSFPKSRRVLNSGKNDCPVIIQLRGGEGLEPIVSFTIATPLKSGGSNLVGITGDQEEIASSSRVARDSSQ